MLSQIQSKLLDMLLWFDEFCQANNLTYYAIGGTFLGAIRHQGFIPWDDDIDVALPRPDYEKMILLSKNVEGKYIIESPYSGNSDYVFSFSKLYDTTTTLIEKTKYRCKRGIYIDIFPLDGIGNDESESVANYKRFDIVNMFLMARTCELSKRRSVYKNLSIILLKAIPNLLVNDKNLSIKVDKLAAKYNFENSQFIGNLMGAYRYKEIFNRNFIGKPARYSFENITIPGFEYYDEYLTQIYGAWKEFPPMEKRHGSHNYFKYDLEKSYLL